MADGPDSPDSKSQNGEDAESIAGTPRWVKLFGLAAVVGLLLMFGIHLAGGGLGAHMPTQ
jgi:hypothetical protein